jgi:hypothetical protein
MDWMIIIGIGVGFIASLFLWTRSDVYSKRKMIAGSIILCLVMGFFMTVLFLLVKLSKQQ